MAERGEKEEKGFIFGQLGPKLYIIVTELLVFLFARKIADKFVT